MWLFTTNVFGQTLIEYKNNLYRFEQSPRLAEVLAKLPEKGAIYWPSMSLFEKNDIQLLNTKNTLLHDLKILDKKTNKSTDDDAIKNLAQHINQWHLAKRLTLNVDYDLARTVDSYNPKLTQGEYILNSGSRAENIYVFGAIDQSAPLKVKHRNHTLAHKYVNSTWLSPLADHSLIVVIQSNGRIQTVPTTDWNQHSVELMPGSQIFVPFHQGLFGPKTSHINQALISLAVNRVLK